MCIRIEGHTDNIGKQEDLQKLSQERADAIKSFLVQKGVTADRISTVGQGARYPLTDNSSDDLRSKNRRVEIVIARL